MLDVIYRVLVIGAFMWGCFLRMAAARADGAPPDAATLVVIASGTGADQKAALKQALSNAVTQAVGTIVDSETVVKNDQVIRDQILTASNAIVSKYEPIGRPTAEAGLVTVRIKATVERRALAQRLQAASVITRPVEGKDLYAQVVTELQNEKDAVKIVQKVFQGFPGNVLIAEPVGDPRAVSKTATDATVGVTVRFSVSMQKYSQWCQAFVPILTKVASKSETFRWNPNDDKGCRALSDRTFKSTFDVSNSSTAVPKEALEHSYDISPRCSLGQGVRARGANLLIVERQGSSKGSALFLDKPAYRELLTAAFALPVTELTLKDQNGQELDGQEHVAMFRTRAGNAVASPFWTPSNYAGKFSTILLGDEGGPNWRPNGLDNAKANAVMVFPYMYMGAGAGYAFSEFTHEFLFKMPIEQLNRLKSVEVKISSRDDIRLEK